MKGLSISRAIWRAAVLALLVPITSLLAAQTDSAKISTLLDEVKIHSARAATDADTLVSFTRSRLSWESHSFQLELIKNHANELIVDFNQLVALRPEGSPWQQEAIDQISPLLTSMASNLTATISHLNNNVKLVHMSPYTNYVQANWELLDKTRQLIADIITYDKAKDRAGDLERELALSPSSRSGE